MSSANIALHFGFGVPVVTNQQHYAGLYQAWQQLHQLTTSSYNTYRLITHKKREGDRLVFFFPYSSCAKPVFLVRCLSVLEVCKQI